MPFAAISVSAGSSILGGLFGGKGASKAASQLAQGEQNAANYANDQKTTGQASIQQGLDDVSGAVSAGQTGVAGATSSGQQIVGQAGATANDALQTALAQQLGLYSPYTQAGATATGQLQQLASAAPAQFSFNPTDLSSDPGYQFTLQQGQQALARSAAATGGLYSSGTAKSLAGYTTGTANQYFNDAYNRSLSTFNTNQQQALNRVSTLQNLASMGLTGSAGSSGAIGSNTQLQSTNTTNAANTIANLGVAGANTNANLGLSGSQLSLSGHEASAGVGTQAANQVTQALTGIGAAQAAGTAGSTQNWLSALGNTNNSILNYLNYRSPGVSGGPGWGPGGATGAYQTAQAALTPPTFDTGGG